MLKTTIVIAARRSALALPAAAQAHVTAAAEHRAGGRATPASTSASPTSATTPRRSRSTSSSRPASPRRPTSPSRAGRSRSPREARHPDPDRRRRDHRGRRADHLDRPTAEDGIPPGAFQDFGLSVQIPGKAGDKLTFKALQTYSNGEIVRWIGAAGLRQSRPGRHRRGGDGGRSRRVAHRRGRGDGHARRAPERNGRDVDRRL